MRTHHVALTCTHLGQIQDILTKVRVIRHKERDTSDRLIVLVLCAACCMFRLQRCLRVRRIHYAALGDQDACTLPLLASKLIIQTLVYSLIVSSDGPSFASQCLDTAGVVSGIRSVFRPVCLPCPRASHKVRYVAHSLQIHIDSRLRLGRD